ncbi:MAG: Gfo/Idh/MocA family oxidoreductase [Candidatus Woesearchaeota archaeon]
MKLFIIGCGSIGARHARNARAKGHELLLYDVDSLKAQALAKELSATVVNNIQNGLAARPDAAFVCTPPNLHVQQALECINEKVPVFIEKPLSHSMENVDRLIKAAEELKVPNMVACNLRFTEGLQKVREFLPLLGKLVMAKIEFGYDLKRWRPGQDYRKNYAVSHDLGGGIVLDAIHELDYAFWLFGQPQKAFSKVMRTGRLEIETEDQAEFILELEKCPAVSIHLDYLNPDYTRNCSIIGEKGTVYWDFRTGIVKARVGGKEEHFQTNTDINAMYFEELDYFINALKNKERMMNPISEAAKTLQCALALRKAGVSE